jgi:DNA polymerase I-like protein with 3'-5' exonuclease and polymerase domains
MIFFDVILRALGFFQIMQIHDEIVGLVPEDNAPKAVERVKWCMENALPLDAPLQVSAQHAERLSEAK